jgi:diacylglycerol kinase (ATP)
VTERQPFRVSARLRSFRHALHGIAAVLQSQHNAWIHAAASMLVVGTGLAIGLGRLEWCALVLAMVAVWAAEALNTAFEALCDVASPSLHPMVERAKDVAAGAVLIAAIGAAITGGLVFAPHLLVRGG